MHVLLAITILLQSLVPVIAVQAADARASGSCGSGTACCCTGGSASDSCAPMQMEACSCLSGDSQRDPKAPPPRELKDTALLAMSLNAIAAPVPDLARPVLRPKSEPSRGNTHNEVQALLCVWRT